MRHTLEGRLHTCVQSPVAGILSTVSGIAKAGLVGLTLVLGGATHAQTVASLPATRMPLRPKSSRKSERLRR